jgi:hypothetical protein
MQLKSDALPDTVTDMSPPRAKPEDQLWDAKEAAAARGLRSHRTIYIWERRGKLARATKKGETPLYRPADVMAVQPAKRHRRTHAELHADGACNRAECRETKPEAPSSL